MNKNKKIIFLASNNLQNDPRVQKQAKGAGKCGFDSIAVGFYWIAPGSELPEIEKKNGYQIQRVLYRPGTIFKNQKDAIAIIFGIFWRLFLTWLWFLAVGFLVIKNDKRTKKNESTSNPTQEAWHKSHFLKIFLMCLYKSGAFFRNLFMQWIVTFDYYSSMTIALADKAIALRPDIIHANDLDSLWAGYLVKKKIGAKLVFDAHEFWLDMGLKIPRPYILAFKLSEKYLLKKIDGYVTVNESIIKKTESFYHHCFRVPAIVVYNCPNFEKVIPRSKKDKIQILYQGRYAYNRGLEQLTEAMRYVSKNAELSFRAIKDPQIETVLKQIVEKNNLRNRVKFLPSVSMGKMVQAAKDFDIGVVAYIPIHVDNELCSPNKLFEYMMAGLALAVSNLPVLRYITRKYQNGVLFDPRDPKSIAEALNLLLSHPAKLMEMKNNSLKAARELNWENQQEKLINLYREILSK